MTIQEAIKSGKKFKRPKHDEASQYFESGTGPYSNDVGCDYFVFGEGSLAMFSTSIDLYAEDILADDWELVD